nr:MAG TPA: hypothetical protein [Inoviridae sp.]
MFLLTVDTYSFNPIHKLSLKYHLISAVTSSLAVAVKHEIFTR